MIASEAAKAGAHHVGGRGNAMLMQAAATQIPVFRRYDLITFASSTLESRAIAQVDAAPLPDETTGSLQFRQRRRNAGTPYAQDDRQHIVGHRNDPVIQPIGRKQQPARIDRAGEKLETGT